MNVILTHEQADFDALAAMLGAYLIFDDHQPVLPRRLNRNTRAFYTLYGSELPFIEARDLPAEAIENVVLVDTQSLITLKGLTNSTAIQVIDHHHPRKDLPPSWKITSEQSGACTTLLVNQLLNNGAALTPVQATLLLLGIYEDTGSLSYISTTAQDMHAAAYVLEQGASLEILGDYLNPPLSPEQRRIYDHLLAAAETHNMNGETVVVTSVKALEMVDEISSVAHKLRDLLDPDALFLLVETVEGVRIVARSTTDRVNVAAVMAKFGGGGHERAAAALVRPEDGLPGRPEVNALDPIRQALLDMLPGFIRPAVTVGQMMSRQPRLLPPDISAAEAATLMQRYGYEGFPVVKDGQVVGLLTRRAVDRALAHRLNLPAASLMDAGQVTIAPGDSVEQLQKVMVASGWGQVPVVDPTNARIVGIVTRTDLLKMLSPLKKTPSDHSLAAKLQTALPPARQALLQAVAARAHNLRMAAYIVGGFVRDLLLNRPGLDFDVVVEGDAIALGQALSREFGGRCVVHSRFGTAKWYIGDIADSLIQALAQQSAGEAEHTPKLLPADLPEFLDLISARSEFYDHPTALPTVERGGIKLDLHRRDFTINTLAVRLDGRHFGELHDNWGGHNDLRQGLIRVLHSLSFIDDPTRLLRAVRFEQRFGFQIETRTLELMREAHPLVKQVSGERLHHEIDLIFAEDRASAMLERLQAMGVLTAIHPDLHWVPALNPIYPLRPETNAAPGDWDLPAHFAGQPIERVLSYITWLVHLPLNSAASVCERLKLSRAVTDAVLRARQTWEALPQLVEQTPSQAVSRLDGIPIISIYAVHRLVEGTPLSQVLVSYAKDWRHIHPFTDGRQLLALGIPPSPKIAETLDALRAAWLDGSVHDQAGEKRLLNTILGLDE
jgi:tRNA nucleotidyltransferase (CCA-adding enzyme)